MEDPSDMMKEEEEEEEEGGGDQGSRGWRFP